MRTDFTPQKLIKLYKMSESVYHEYLQQHRKKLNELADTRVKSNGKVIRSRRYNTEQLALLLTVFGDAPEGYEFDGKTFIKLES